MYAYCATELVNPASMSFEWAWVHVVWKLVYLCALAISRYSLWSCGDEMDSFLSQSLSTLSVEIVCLSDLKNNWDEADSESEAIGTGQCCKWTPRRAPF